ncbi:MAG: redoxin domain-containing protein [Candidatus Omnitrophica bacterium]|nr:redoxin domain-containing protein [Candidatus Omnitrophota bacterium]
MNALAVQLALVLTVIPVNAVCAEGEELVGTPAPEWVFSGWMNAGPLTLKGLKGHPVLIRFWTDECPFCTAAGPLFNRWHERYGPRGLVVIGVYHPKPPGLLNEKEVQQAARALGMTFPIALDPDWQTLHRYWIGGRVRAFTSASFLIGPDGVIRYVHDGGFFTEAQVRELEQIIQKVL